MWNLKNENYLRAENKAVEKQIVFKDGMEEGELNEGIQNVQTSSYKINKFQGHNVNMMTTVPHALGYMSKS